MGKKLFSNKKIRAYVTLLEFTIKILRSTFRSSPYASYKCQSLLFVKFQIKEHVFLNSSSIDKVVDIIRLDIVIQVQAPTSSFIFKFLITIVILSIHRKFQIKAHSRESTQNNS